MTLVAAGSTGPLMLGSDEMNAPGADFKRGSTCLYLVLHSRGAWWVEREGKSLGPYDTQGDAQNGALNLIEMFGDPSRPIELWAPDDAGKMRLFWSGHISQ